MLYPKISTNNSGHIQVSTIHNVYWEECGNPEGKPVVFVHGGPGGGVSADTRRFFDPNKYRIIQFDQRGCGKSTPHACVEENTTWDLIKDMEVIRQHLKIEKWQVFGGSWGSTLSLLYSITHPEKVTELILRGIFLLRSSELQWFYQEGTSYLFADAWKPYYEFIPEAERSDMIMAYHKRLFCDDEALQLEAAKQWSTWEGATCHLVTNEERVAQTGDDEFALAFARLENHYFVNKGFLKSDNYILENINKIRHIPTVIINGRYDVICPVKTACDLHEAFPESELYIIDQAGHSAFEENIINALVKATDKFADI